MKFILAVLNSAFIGNYWTKNFSDLRTTFPKIKGSYLEKLPVPNVDFTNAKQKQKHDEIVRNVEVILNIKEEMNSVRLQSKIDQLQGRMDHSEERINKLVYELYGLSQEEIEKIEAG